MRRRGCCTRRCCCGAPDSLAALVAAVLLLVLVCSPLPAASGSSLLRRGRQDTHAGVVLRSNVVESLSTQPAALRHQALFLQLTQVVRVPSASVPSSSATTSSSSSSTVPHRPRCPKEDKLGSELRAAITLTFGRRLLANASLDTSLTQVLDTCTYRSFVSITGDPSVRAELVAAAAGGPSALCSSLPGYCEAAGLTPERTHTSSGSNSHRGSHRGGVLVSTQGDADPPLPPVLEFNCSKFSFLQQLDHFGDRAGERQHPQTFKQVYWVCDGAWPSHRTEQSSSGNVLVFLGNESPLGVPGQPIVFENARRLNALVVLVEHRYYGESLPFSVPPGETLPTSHYKWLTMAQVIEDTAAVVQHVRAERGVLASVPAVVIGGSYGGMIASYHRVVRPDVFDAAIAASAPVTYIVGTRMWRRTANKYHQFIDTAVNDACGGSTACSDTIRDGLRDMLALGRTDKGRAEVAAAFKLCGGAAALPSEAAVAELEDEVIGDYQGLAQGNNQPPVLGALELACSVLRNATAAGASPLAATAAVHTYMSGNGSTDWCWEFSFNASAPHLIDGPSSYSYQVCREATVMSSELPAHAGRGARDILQPNDRPVTPAGVAADCRQIFGAQLHTPRGPPFARHILRQLRRVGGVVFTNGDADGWAGGSLGIRPGTRPRLQQQQGTHKDLEGLHGLLTEDELAALDAEEEDGPDSATQTTPRLSLSLRHGWAAPSWSSRQQQHAAAPTDPGRRLAYVVYAGGASHCTDTHTAAWEVPGQPPRWRRLRARAMDYAVQFARQNRRRGGGGKGRVDVDAVDADAEVADGLAVT